MNANFKAIVKYGITRALFIAAVLIIASHFKHRHDCKALVERQNAQRQVVSKMMSDECDDDVSCFFNVAMDHQRRANFDLQVLSAEGCL